MIDISVMNAYIVWLSLNRNCDKKLRKRRNFIIELGKELAQVRKEKRRLEEVEASTSSSHEPPKKKSRCSVCPSKKGRKTRTTCQKCKRYVCGEHSKIFCNNCI